MANKVGPKGQVVIEKTIRDKLGVKPGWIAIQLLVDDHIQIHFIPPEHNESVAGILSHYAKPEPVSERVFQEARELTWKEAAGKRWAEQEKE